MRITGLVSALVVQPVHRDPVGRAALQRDGAAYRHYVLYPFGRGKTAVSELAMVTDSNAHVLANYPHGHKDDQRGPVERKKCCDSSEMKAGNDRKEYPVEC